MPASVDTATLDSYRHSCLDICAEKLSGYASMADIAADEDRINAYPNLENLSEPKGVVTLDEEAMDRDLLDRAVECVLDGRFLAEHAAAGEATRLKMGTKYLINPARILNPETAAKMLAEEEGKAVSPADFLELTNGIAPSDLLDMSLGLRHMLQMAFDLTKMAIQAGRNPASVLAEQKMLVILNEKTAEEITAQFLADNFMGFERENVLFMVQASFEGIGLKQGRFEFDPASPNRLHNHGQMAMQTVAENQVFRLSQAGERLFLSRQELTGLLQSVDDKLSYNIEDLGYLTSAIDLPALALALKLGNEGYRMVMEIVANSSIKPQKGGLAAWDGRLGRNVMIESFQLMGLPNEEIKFLNKNFNHYPQPAAAFEALTKGLPMPIAVKGGFIYFQPIQGDLNFLLKTAFVQRKVLKPIYSWKSAATTAPAIKAMADQDAQDGFREFAQDILGRKV